MADHFPPLTPEMQAHSDAMLERLRIESETSGGILTFARFMELALYAPGLGYYSAGSSKFGLSGDFVTAPEISPLFARSLARSFADILNTLSHREILEMGAGSGAFARELLLELERGEALPTHYFILETSADLRKRQQTLLKETCPSLFPRISWLDRLPTQFSGILFANEILDALPLHCFRIGQEEVLERYVTLKNQQLTWDLRPTQNPELKQKVLSLKNQLSLAEGYESEINLLLPQWIETLAKIMQKGVMLFFDYGENRQEYYRPERSQGSLRCFFRHRCHADPFLFPGLQDITADVDFTAVVEAAHPARLELRGYTTQSAFLLDCGIAELTNEPPSNIQHYQQNQALKRLMLPQEMGNRVKAIALAKHFEFPIKGFSLFDRRMEL